MPFHFPYPHWNISQPLPATHHSPLAYLPLYEARMIWHYDHRYGTYQDVRDRSGTQLPTPDERQYADPQFVVQSWYRVPAEEVAARPGDWKRSLNRVVTGAAGRQWQQGDPVRKPLFENTER